MGFLDRVRSGCEQSATFKSVNMAVDMKNKYGGSIRSHDCYLKWCIKNSSTQYSFYVMESGVSRNCFRNIHRPSTLEKEVDRKGNILGKIARRRKIRKFTHAHGSKLRKTKDKAKLSLESSSLRGALA